MYVIIIQCNVYNYNRLGTVCVEQPSVHTRCRILLLVLKVHTRSKGPFTPTG